MNKFAIVLMVFSSFTFAKIEGGISGGGGDVINPTPPSTVQSAKEVRHVIKESKHILYRYLRNKYQQFSSGSMSADEKVIYSIIFKDHDDEICQITEDIKIDIPTDQACFDGQGNAHDGSSFNPTDKTICISAYRIAQKAHMREIPVQAAALILHEYGEALGLDEEQAVVIQEKAISELKIW